MRGETAELIVDVANGLMVERGYAAFSYADVSERVGIRKASIHHHFPTKTELAVAVLRRHRARLEQAMEHLDGSLPNPLDRLRAYVEHWEACIRDGSVSFCVAALLSAELPALPEEVQAEVRAHFRVLSGWLAQTLSAGVKAGQLTLGAAPVDEAQMLMASVHGAMLSARATGDCDVFRVVARAAVSRLTPTA